MAKIFDGVSKTFGEFLLIPGLTAKNCRPEEVNLKTPLVKFKNGEGVELLCRRYPTII
jgi:IMP dehydrogenase